MKTWTEHKDGIWPMFFTKGMEVIVTQYGRGDWRWTSYATLTGKKTGKTTNARSAKAEALASC